MNRQYNIVAPTAAHVAIAEHMPRAYVVASFDNSHSPKTQRELQSLLRGYGYHCESVFDCRDGKGNKYALLVYSSREERSDAFRALHEAAITF